jgi:hypothetical protein
MALSTKVDYFNQTANAVIKQISSASNTDFKAKPTATNERGDIIVRTPVGQYDNPSCEFVVFADGDLDLDLGSVYTYNNTHVACLLGISIQTSAGNPAKVTLSGEELQAGATVTSTIDVTAIALSARHKAQILMTAFTMSGSGCYLTDCSLDVKANMTRATQSGLTIAHDVSGATITVKGTVVQSGATAPTIAPSAGWTLNTPTSTENPDEGYTTWTFECTKDLTSTEPA